MVVVRGVPVLGARLAMGEASGLPWEVRQPLPGPVGSRG